MKKLLLIIFATLIPFGAYATYLICDAGPQHWIGEADSTKSLGEAFEVQLLDNNQATLDGLPFCSPIFYYTTDTHVHMSCDVTDKGSVYDGSVSISRVSGLYSYDFKITFEGTMIAWWLQKAKCSVAEKKLF